MTPPPLPRGVSFGEFRYTNLLGVGGARRSQSAPHMHVLVRMCSNVRRFTSTGRSLVLQHRATFSPGGSLFALAKPYLVNPKGTYMV